MSPAPVDFATMFADCRNGVEVTDLYKRLHDKYGGREIDTATYIALSECHRQALENLMDGARPVRVSTDDVDHIRPRVLRNWCAKQGIGLSRKGRVPTEIENRYRAEQGLALLPSEPPTITPEDVGTTAAVIRAWAKENEIEVPVKGRVHSSIVYQWKEAQSEA